MPKPINHQEKIQLTDSNMDVFMKISEGNPGAIRVVMELFRSNFDPDSPLGSYVPILSLDHHGIYGSSVWVLFKECCGGKILNVVTVLRAVQLGLFTDRELWDHIDTDKTLPMDDLYAKVKAQLPAFNTVS